jgi:hypothetical protein
MRLKILAAVVFGLAAIAIMPLSQATPAGSAVMAQLAATVGTPPPPVASAARTRPTPTPTPTAAPPAAVATDCTIMVPANPLSAQGLATPYRLTQAAGAPKCSESNPGVQAFVQAAVVDPASGQIAVYNPLVIDQGSRAGVAPIVPALPAGGVVGIWFGYNGGVLTLAGAGASHCVSGIPGSAFGQFSYCNAGAFFRAANAAIAAGKLNVPALPTAKDGKPCPTTRDFMVVDQDQSDNVTTSYLIAANGTMAQNTPANVKKMAGGKAIVNGSDEGLVSRKMSAALGCPTWTAPDLADPAHTPVTALPLNELQAAAHQKAPIATVPTMDPMTLVNGQRNLAKLNAYRLGVDQLQLSSFNPALTTPYCKNLLSTGLPRIAQDKALLQVVTSPDAAVATNLFTFLGARFQATFSATAGFLGCTTRLNVHNPVTLTTDANGVVTAATINISVPDRAAAPAAPAATTAADVAKDAAPAPPDTTQADAAVVPATATNKAAPVPLGAALSQR